MKNVAILEDHPLVSSGLKSIVKDLWKNAEVFTCDKFEALEKQVLNESHFDFIIADIHLDERNILEQLILLSLNFKNLKIILYSSSQPWELGLNQDKFPFYGYVRKSADLEMITKCILQINKQSNFFQPDLIWKNPVTLSNENVIVTKREWEILLLLKSGKTNKEIGDLLFLSELTIKSHRQNMMRKFESKNVAELIAKTSHLF